MKRTAFASIGLLAVTACAASTTRYPSLAPRAIETRGDAEPVTAPVAVTADAALDARLASMVALLAANDKTFAGEAASAESAARRPQSQIVGSDAWVGAQAALADLETARGETLSTVTDLERLVTDRGEAGTAPYPRLDSARAQAQAQLEGETARIAAIKALLGQK
ncbi:hypothetical protein [uncultured Sphingomonas sp.]|uniref:hypothetical protein n=1 Tax=uncultured Sphingomonas sp. TaxID=158754 RepID=UPI0035CC7B09